MSVAVATLHEDILSSNCANYVFIVLSCLAVKIDIINETVDYSQCHCSNDGDDPQNVTEEPRSREILESMQCRLRAVNLTFLKTFVRTETRKG